jgi:hypothetical protein
VTSISLFSPVCHDSFLEDQPMDLGVLGVEQRCRECSIRLFITGVEQRIEHRPREIVHISVAPCGKKEEDDLELECGIRRHLTEPVLPSNPPGLLGDGSPPCPSSRGAASYR